MPLIAEQILDEVQSRIDIVDLINRYVPLKRTGRHFKGLCPFHKERTPSFVVNAEKQIFHCFGCGVGGNVFSFLMHLEHLTFPEAARQLAELTGISIPEENEEPSAGQREKLLRVVETATLFFEKQLQEPLGKAARAYVLQRGVTEEARKRFRLGLAPAGWDNLIGTFRRSGVPEDLVEPAGLLVRGKSGYYDRFRSRLMFPIMDLRSRTIGFGGRSLDGQDPKYLNSPETLLYSKGRQLFGLAQAKDSIIQKKTAIVVEGYFDCVVLFSAGVTNVISPSGTALTLEQVRLLKRYAERVILAFDADAAGELATLRGIDLLVEAGLNVAVAQFPSGTDPDEYVRAHGKAQLERLLENSINLFEVLMQSALRKHPGSTVEVKVRAAQFVLPTLAKVPDAILRSEYVRQLAERLSLNEQAVAQELSKIASGRSSEPKDIGIQASAASSVPAPAVEQLLVGLVLDDPSRYSKLQEELPLSAVTDLSLRKMLSLIGQWCEQQVITAAQIVSRLGTNGEKATAAALVELAQTVLSKEEALEDCIRRLKAAAHKRQLQLLRQRIEVAQTQGQQEETHELLTAYQQFLKPSKAQEAF